MSIWVGIRQLIEKSQHVELNQQNVVDKGKNNGLGTGRHFFSKVAPGSQGFWMNRPTGTIFSEPGATFIKSNMHIILRVKEGIICCISSCETLRSRFPIGNGRTKNQHLGA